MGVIVVAISSYAPSGGVEALENLEGCGCVWRDMLDGFGADNFALELENLLGLERVTG
jgi:hypothetical protein